MSPLNSPSPSGAPSPRYNMPIRINLLAEQQAAEEMRRRDPIKRAIYAGAFLVVLMILWIAATQVKVSAARKELADYQQRLAKVEEASKEVRNDRSEIAIQASTIEDLDEYSTNRFFWGSFLNAVQHIALDKIRLVEISGRHKYVTNDVATLTATNLILKVTPPPPMWKFWASGEDSVPVDTLIERSLGSITNRGKFLTNLVPYKLKTTYLSTNANKVNTKLEFSTVPWASEQITVIIRGRDYGTPHGAAIDEFTRRMTAHELFKEWLDESEGFRFTERPPLPRTDPADPVNPGALFVPFTIECRFKKRVFTNE